MTFMVKVSSLEAVAWSGVMRRIRRVGTICTSFI